jgi:dephospho-CoA kinase
VEALLHDIIQLLIRVGPWIVFVVAATETAVFLGLLIPAEATVLVAAFMADVGYFRIEHVLFATVLGGLTGDHVGYVLGRVYGQRAAARGGRLGRLWRRYEARATLLFRRKSILAVTLARFISFVRTLMPWFAGMTGMSYRRFFVYDLLGVLGWGCGSVAAGYLAGRSWQVLASALGTASTVIIVVIIGAVGVFAVRARRRTRELVRVALTGNVASGKSAVAEIWQELGAAVIDADELARRVVAPGTRALREVVRRFGQRVLRPDGSLDRAALRAIVFFDEASRRALEAILHPEIEQLRRQEERRLAARGERIVVHTIPLLFETGMDDWFDVVVLVDAPAELRRQRMLATRELPVAEADAIIAAQLPAAQKRPRSHYVIDNDGTLEQLRERAEDVWAQVEARVA